MDNATLQVAPSHVLPTSLGLDYKEITIVHKERKVMAWLVESRKEKQNSIVVMMFNGIGGNLPGWRCFQKCLTDSINFFNGGTAIFDSANSNKQFVQFENYKHNDIFKEANFNYWVPIIKFIKFQTL